MAPTAPEVRFVRALAAGILREGEGAPVAAQAALRDFLATEKSLVLEVQFTGFARRGEQVGGVHPLFLRAASQLIILRVNRVGFTAEAGEAELRALFDALSRPSAELPEEGVVGLLRELAPRGVFLSTSGGGVYRPERAEEPPAPTSPPVPEARAEPAEAPAAPAEPVSYSAALDFVSADSIVDFEEFELLETSGNPLPVAGAGETGPTAPPPAARDEPPADDLFHFFRAATPGRAGASEAEELAQSLRGATTVMRFDELTQQAVAAVPRLLETGEEMRAVALVEALAEETRRADRSRLFRDSAQQGLRKAATDPVLARFAELLERGGEIRERVLRVFLAVGGGAFPLLESVVVRTGDAGLREAVFRAMLESDPGGSRVLERAMAEPAPRARALLELATLPGVDEALTRRWLERAAAHPDAAVRADVVRLATQAGSRGGIRILRDLLADADESVRRAAVRAMGELAEPSAVPFLARVLNEAGDDDLQLDAIAALGRIGTAETLPALTAVLGRRQLFAGKRLARLKLAAVAAVGRIPLPAAREVLAPLAAGKDAELAAEARRALAAQG
ncbi:MAG TPA: HEAT repeat domain-containing protein [Longimicrobiaceae bacterium]|nr:HEAT repeat domain-containing protein [Longimicrobiaceae bacterium]